MSGFYRKPDGRAPRENGTFALPADHVRVLHAEAQGGKVAAAMVAPRWRERAVPVRDLGRYVAALRCDCDVYLSQARFNGWRGVKNLASINAAWVDLDCYRAPAGPLAPDVALGAVFARCEERGLPVPSYVVASGRGLALVWLVEVLPRRVVPRWRLVQVELIALFRDLGADAAAHDPARMLRVVGSVNTKTCPPAPVRCLWPIGEPQVYAFEELCAAALPYTREEVRAFRRKANGRKRNPSRSARPAEPRVVPLGPGVDVAAGLLWATRLDDLQKLRRALRWFGPLPPGERDIWLFLAACALAWMVPARRVRREVLALAGEALGGAWTARLVEEQMGSALRRAEAAARGETVLWKGVPVDPRYRFRTATILDWLSITEAEQRQLATLIGPAVQSERQAERGRRSGAVRREGTRERDARIVRGEEER